MSRRNSVEEESGVRSSSPQARPAVDIAALAAEAKAVDPAVSAQSQARSSPEKQQPLQSVPSFPSLAQTPTPPLNDVRLDRMVEATEPVEAVSVRTHHEQGDVEQTMARTNGDAKSEKKALANPTADKDSIFEFPPEAGAKDQGFSMRINEDGSAEFELYKKSKCKTCWDKTGEILTIPGHILAGGFGIYIAAIFGFLAMQKNIKNLAWAGVYLGCSFAANVLPAYNFLKNMPGYFTKVFHRKENWGPVYRLSAGLGFFAGTLNAFSGFKLAIDAISNNPEAAIRQMGAFAIGSFTVNNWDSRIIGNTEFFNRLFVFTLQTFKKEWETHEPLFTLLEDLKFYGASLRNFSYKDSDNLTLPQLAQEFYTALREQGIKPVQRTGQVILKVLQLLINGAAVYLAWPLWVLFSFLSENGLNATGKLFGSGAWGSEIPILTWFATVFNVVFYLQYSTQTFDFAVDLVNLPARRFVSPNLGTVAKVVVGGALVTAIAGAINVIGYWSGSGMGKEASDAYASSCNNPNNSTCINTNGTVTFANPNNSTFYTSNSGFYDALTYPAPLLDYIGYVVAVNAGNIVNMGSGFLSIGRRFFNTGTKLWQGNDRGINDFIDLTTKIIRSRKYSMLGESAADQMAAIHAIGRARKEWSEPNFSWCSFFQKCRQPKNYLPLASANLQNQDTDPYYYAFSGKEDYETENEAPTKTI